MGANDNNIFMKKLNMVERVLPNQISQSKKFTHIVVPAEAGTQ